MKNEWMNSKILKRKKERLNWRGIKKERLTATTTTTTKEKQTKKTYNKKRKKKK